MRKVKVRVNQLSTKQQRIVIGNNVINIYTNKSADRQYTRLYVPRLEYQ